jgi:hypothetical protein
MKKKLNVGIAGGDLTIRAEDYRGDRIAASWFDHEVMKVVGGHLLIVRAGAKLGDIGHAIQQCVEREGFSVVRELAGHGVGHHAHESR